MHAGADADLSEGRDSLSGAERARYQASVAAHRPFRLELLRWNHDPEGPDAYAFEQLRCLTGDFRSHNVGGADGGIGWTCIELEGVFLRHRAGQALIWIPEAGPNLLLQQEKGGPWSLVEFVQLEKQSVVKDRVRSKRVAAQDDVAGPAEEIIKVAMPLLAHPTPRLHVADPHLTDLWLQAAEDLQLLWRWAWRPLRATSPFEFVQDKLVCAPKYPIADAARGMYGETRWQWRYVEDGRGHLVIRNHSWSPGVRLLLSMEDVSFAVEDAEGADAVLHFHDFAAASPFMSCENIAVSLDALPALAPAADDGVGGVRGEGASDRDDEDCGSKHSGTEPGPGSRVNYPGPEIPEAARAGLEKAEETLAKYPASAK